MAAFQWEPDEDQVYNDDVDLKLSGSPESFNKAAGKTFTMDAPFRTLTLEVTDSGADSQSTSWGGGVDDPPTTINVNRGIFQYSLQSPDTEVFLFISGLGTTLRVVNDAQFSFNDPDGRGALFSRDIFNIEIQDLGVVAVRCAACNLSQGDGDYVNISVSALAKISVDATSTIDLLNGTVNVTSRPETGYSFSCTVTAIPGGIIGPQIFLENTEISFTYGATGLLKAPELTLIDTRVRVTDTSALDIQFDTCDFTGASQFILGPSMLDSSGKSATIRFDAYTPGNQPFDFEKYAYPQGIFEFTSGTDGIFILYLPGNAIAANYMLQQGVIAIDGQPQTDRSRLSFIYNTDGREGYTTVRLTTFG
jgi:hypothetical protein